VPSTFIHRMEQRLGHQAAHVLRGMLAYGSAEMAGRVVRLATTIVIARRLTPGIVGEAALALTIFELVRVLERVGTGQQIVIAAEHELGAVCNTVRRIYWGWTLALMAAQLVTATLLAGLGHRVVAGQMLAALALVFPFMAVGHVPYHLAMRAGKVGHLARINAWQAIADQLVTLGLMLLWPSPWAIVLPKILAAPVWLACALRAQPWAPDPLAGFLPPARILRSSGSILLADGLVALRTQGDNLIVAGMLGTTMLGTYYFAFNAGLGIVTALVGAFGSVIFPMMARAPAGAQRLAVLRKTALLGLGLFLPLVVVQSAAARLYVPLVFGAHWAPAAPLVGLLCLAGGGLAVGQLTTAWLRANGRMELDASNSLVNCLVTLGGLACGALTGTLAGAAWGLVGANLAVTLLLAWRALGPDLWGHGARPPRLETAPS
jgi:O-antigen/teichoic acid export membrane protein